MCPTGIRLLQKSKWNAMKFMKFNTLYIEVEERRYVSNLATIQSKRNPALCNVKLGQTEILLRRNKLPMIYPHYSYTIER